MGDFALLGFADDGRCLLRMAGFQTVGDAQASADVVLIDEGGAQIVIFHILTSIGGPVLEIGEVDRPTKKIEWTFI